MMTIWMVIWMKSWMSMNIINILMSNLLFLEISTRMPFLRHSSKCVMTPSTSRKSTDSRASFLMKSSRFMPFADIMATELRRTGSISHSFAICASLAWESRKYIDALYWCRLTNLITRRMHSLSRNVVALMRKDGRRGSGGGFLFRIGSLRSSSELSLSELFSMIIGRFACLFP